MYTLVVHDDAEADLEDLWENEPDAAARIEVVLEELQGSQRLLDSLLDHDFGAGGTAPFHVSRWQALWNQRGGGRDIWRLKVWDLERQRLRYRIIYAYEIRRRRFHVLAILPRDFDYDLRDERSKRLIAAYDDLR